MNRYIMVDVEADGPCPGLNSMVQIGAVLVDRSLRETFYGELRPISNVYEKEALKVIGITREQSEAYPDPTLTMQQMSDWLISIGLDGDGSSSRSDKKSPIFISDNNGWDFQWVNYYFWTLLNYNPFGHSSRNLGDLYKGMKGTTRGNFKHLRQTKHDHNPLNDATGNAEALIHMVDFMGLKGIIDG